MIISQEFLSKINKIQLEILSNVIEVCDKLNLNYFMVHGSLLGAIQNSGFMPLDDDIDIALPRADYNVFITQAQKYLKEHYFIQSNLSEEKYPLPFAKVRDSRTTYVIEKMKHLNIHQGIYIDIFPIDYYKANGIKSIIRHLEEKILNIRIGCVFLDENITAKQKIRQFLSRVICPSYKRAIKRRDALYQTETKSNFIIITGGKKGERGIPKEWFADFIIKDFEGLKIKVPKEYDKYLRAIYGDYKNYDVADSNRISDNQVKVNACAIDLNKPFTNVLYKLGE